MEGKIIVISAPSGCGKSTIIGRLFDGGDLNMRFSVSASRVRVRKTVCITTFCRLPNFAMPWLQASS